VIWGYIKAKYDKMPQMSRIQTYSFLNRSASFEFLDLYPSTVSLAATLELKVRGKEALNAFL
jgi:hypothetical protein